MEILEDEEHARRHTTRRGHRVNVERVPQPIGDAPARTSEVPSGADLGNLDPPLTLTTDDVLHGSVRTDAHVGREIAGQERSASSDRYSLWRATA
jgi:hypothetical protein